MESILATFGVDWRLLLINAINFGLLLLGLSYFLYKPLTNMLEERRQKIAEGVSAAAAAQKRLSEIESARTQKLAEAGREADTIVGAARAAGSARERELIAAGEATALSLLRDAELQAADLKERALAESKHEVAKLIVLGMEKALKHPQGKQ